MIITKYLHSCLLVKEKDTVILLDPGQYTYEAKVLDVNFLEKLDYILITHEHSDHFWLPFIKKLQKKFFQVQIISTETVVKQLQKEGLNASTKETAQIHIEPVAHEEILFAPVPKNIKFTLFNKLTHPGDSFQFASNTDILAMPMIAPWGSLVEAMKKIVEIKPKTVLPIHDWHWKDEARETFYPRVQEYLKPYEIKFIQTETGEAIEVENS